MDWEIGSSSLACAGCNKPFVEEQEIFSALYDGRPTFARRDYCSECWPRQDRRPVFSHWRTRLPKRDAPVRRFVDDEVVLDFFKRLEGSPEPAKIGFRYVLGLLLMRKKVLKLKEFRRAEAPIGQAQGKGAALILHDRLRDCDYEVADPNLTEEQIRQMTGEINQILNVKA
jgi:hypothetical protein